MTLQTPLEYSTLHPAKSYGGASATALKVVGLILLAFMQVSWKGYEMGVGNQGIQIAFLRTLHDPQLFTRDIMVHTTLDQYPSWFFHIFAKFLSFVDVPVLYVWLHLAATAGTLIAVAWLSKAMFDDEWAGLTTVVLLLAGHHQALAGEALYSSGLTHTWAVFPLTILALILFYRENYWAAFGLAGIIFNLHALEAGQLALLMGFVCLCEVRRIGAEKVAALAGLFVATAAPTIAKMARQMMDMRRAGAAIFDAEWLNRMHERSADHSFPSSWWQPGDSEIPQFLMIVGLAAVALGFWGRTAQRRKTLLLAVAVGIVFAVGYLFTDIWPVAIVVRAQLFRSSRFLMIIALAVIAEGCVCAWRMPFARTRTQGNSTGPATSWRAVLEFACATLIALTLAVPPLIKLLPLTLAAAMIVALINGRLTWYQSVVAAVALFVCLRAWQDLHFVIPGLSPGVTWESLGQFQGPGMMGWWLLLVGVVLWILSQDSFSRGIQPLAIAIGLGQRNVTRGAHILASGLGIVVGIVVLCWMVPGFLKQNAGDKDWIAVQLWARENTPKNALFLTPARQLDFRIDSQRSVVGEWRDGTQLYFSAAYTKIWWDTMQALQPGLLPGPDNKEIVSYGKSLEDLDDEQLMALAKRFGAEYVVIKPNDSRLLERVDNVGSTEWAVYRPRIGVASTMPGADSAKLQRQIAANIEKRKSEARVQVVSETGRPIDGARYTITQTSSAFGFGVSLPFFKKPAFDFKLDVPPPEVTPAELAQVAGVFNYSVTLMSGQWRILQPTENGKMDFSDLDAYVDWCNTHGVRVEFSFLAGYQPVWMRGMAGAETKLTTAHALDVVKHFADRGSRIDSYQVAIERVGMNSAVAVFAALRKAYPNIKLGIGDDGRFWSVHEGTIREAQMLRGIDDVRTLKKAGVKIDFFAFEGHRPLGLWADGHDIYSAMDAFAKEGVKVHVTEAGVPVGARIEGSVRHGVWTPELQAEYYEQLFTICYSHPNVEAINLSALGSKSWTEGEGLLDDKDEPTPAYDALKKLITEKWRTKATPAVEPDGGARFTGFQGDYELAVTLASGETYRVPFTVQAGASNNSRFVLNAAAGSLTGAEGH